MQFSTLTLSLLASSTSTLALVMHRPHFLDFRSPSPLDAAFMEANADADLTTRSLIAYPKERSGPQCTARNDIVLDYGSLPGPSPGLRLYHIAAGRGTQNYTCPSDAAETSAPQAVGAVATLFNVTCLKAPQNTKVYTTLFDKLAQNPLPSNADSNPNQSGHHYFTNGNATATFNLHTTHPSGNLGITFSNKIANVSAPTTAAQGTDGTSAVAWLKLSVIGDTPKPATTNGGAEIKIQSKDQVGGVKEIYRVNTVGGNAPKTCAGLVGKTFERQYAAEYWFFH